MTEKNDLFCRFARSASKQSGKPWVFGAAVLIILLWAVLGPVFKFSDTWQLVINTSTTIITFLMVFLIQNTQNRDSEAMHLKLDELIRASSAHNALLDIEELTDQQLDQIKVDYEELAKVARPELETPQEEEEPVAPVKKQPAPGRKKKPRKKKVEPPKRSTVAW
ncbi:MAG: low affinity iron permease family protein [Chthoniobacterales bacterium]